MFKNLLVLFFIFITFQTYGQKKVKDFVEKNLSVIKTIEPDSLNFNDLEVFGKAIGDSRIVMLGEQDHGDAPTFLAKTRLIKYLHEQKGFNILAFEEDFFAMNNGWDLMNKDKSSISSFLKYNVTSLWSGCKQCENLFYSYIPNTFMSENGLQITGFDSQIYRSYSQKKLKKFIHEFLKSKNIAFTKTEVYESDFLSYIDSALVGKNLEKHQKLNNAMKTLITQLSNISKSDDFEIMVIKNLNTTNNTTIAKLLNKLSLEDRDQQMADNLKWLMQNKYPNEKIIVWAHSAHIFKNPELVEGNLSIKQSMGNLFTQDSLIRENTFIVGFNSKHGTAGRLTLLKKFDVQNPIKNSFEMWMPPTVSFAFIDFKKFNKEEPKSTAYFYMKGIAHSANLGIWNKVYDGIFYIRDMYPCEKIK